MKFYKDNNGSLWALDDDGSQDHLIKERTLFPCSDADAEVIINPPETNEQKNEKIKREIAKIEQNEQPRALRESVLSTDLTNLAKIDEKIAALRAQLIR